MRKDWVIFLFCSITMLVSSCDFSDFQMERLAKSDELSPIIYRPVSLGTYVVKDYATVPGIGNTPIKIDSLKLKTIVYQLDSMKFKTSGIDSMVVIIKTINETPTRYRYSLSFSGKKMDSGSKPLNAAITNTHGDVIEASSDSLEYKLNKTDISNLGGATQMDLSITLYQPLKGNVLPNVLRNSPITFYIGFRAPVNLFKVKL